MQHVLLKSRTAQITVAIVLTVLLGGCAGGLIAGLLQWAAVGAIVGNVSGLFDEFDTDPDQYQAFFDGYPLGQRPNNTGNLDLRGLPTGTHLISVIDDEYRTGFHQQVEILTGHNQLPLGAINPVEGAVIGGKVEREASGGGSAVVANLPVVAIFEGANMLAAGGGATISIPPTEGATYVMGYTDDTGTYRLGPCISGTWLVTTALPGYYADARLVAVTRTTRQSNEDLYLAVQDGAESARVSGSVTQRGAQALAQALVYTQLEEAYSPVLTEERATEVEGAAGFGFIAQPWFAWTRLGTVSGEAGAYTMRTGTGAQTVTGFKYGYQAGSVDLELSSGDDYSLDFDLPKR